ncbi:MAG: SRPBCC family protein [Tissierellia bacterium]|nr:SRPBCC family protein [Tissierellia bacterium]
MIRLEESILIECSLDKLYSWFLNFDKNFVDWSPYHTEFEKLSGGFEKGDKIRFVEIVDGINYDVKGEILEHIKTENSFRLVFKAKSGLAHIYFIAEKTESGCKFTHIEEFGKRRGIFKNFINWIAFDILLKNKADWELIRRDMIEDNLYLKNYLETGLYGYEKNAQ